MYHFWLRIRYFLKHHTIRAVFYSLLITLVLVLTSVAIDSPETINDAASTIRESSTEIAGNIRQNTLALLGVTPEPVTIAVVGDCEDQGNQSNCNAIPGCSWTGGQTVQCSNFGVNNCPAACNLNPPTSQSCSQFNNNQVACDDTQGCSWEEECTSTTKQCSLLSVLNCNNYDGCWVQVNSTPAYCSCSVFNASQSLCENNGCTWYNQQTTSQCKGTYSVVNCDDVCEGTYQSGGSCTGTYQTGGSCTGDPIQNSPEPSPNCTSYGFNCVSQSLCSAEGGTVKSGYACSSGKICCNLPTNPSPSPSSSGGSGGGGNTPPGVCEPECTSSSQCGAGRYCVYSSDGCTNYCDDKPQICNAGESRCIGNTLQKCSSDGTAYNTAQTCQSGTTCNSYLGICQQTTSSGATICEPECTSSSQCEDDEYCSISSNGCSNYCVKQSCNPGTPPACKSYSPTSSYSLSCTSLGVELALNCAYGCDATKGTCFPPIQAQTITTTSITNCITDCRNEGNSPSECNAACIPAECEGIPIGSSCVVDNRGGTCELIPGNQKVCIPIPAETTNIRCNSTGAYIETKDDDNNWNPTEFCASYCSDASGFPTCIDLSNITYTPTFDPSDNLALSQDPTVAAAFQAEYLNAINNCVASGKTQQECESIWAEPLQQATQTGDTCITYYTIQDPSRSIDDIKAQCDTEKANALIYTATVLNGTQVINGIYSTLSGAYNTSYSYVTAYLSTAPTWVQTTVGLTLTGSGVYGAYAGYQSCLSDYSSPECAATVALLLNPYEVYELASSLDDLTLPLRNNISESLDNVISSYFLESEDIYNVTLYKGISNYDPEIGGILPGGLSPYSNTTTKGTTYNIGSGVVDEANPDSIIRHAFTGQTQSSPYSSWTTKIEVAEKYAGPNGTILEMSVSYNDPRLVDIGTLINYEGYPSNPAFSTAFMEELDRLTKYYYQAGYNLSSARTKAWKLMQKNGFNLYNAEEFLINSNFIPANQYSIIQGP